MRDYSLVDIHFHTNDSFDAYENSSNSNYDLNQIIEVMTKERKVSLVCKTDHNIINYEKYLTEKKVFSENEINLLPGIEIRGNDKVHWLFIFNDTEFEEIVETSTRGKLLEEDLYESIFKYDEDKPLIEQAKEIQNQTIDIESIIQLFHQHKITYLAVPHLKKTGGFYNVIKSHPEVFKQLIEYLNDSVIHGFESKQQSRFIIDSIIETQINIDRIINESVDGIKEDEGLHEREEHLSMLKELESGIINNNVSVIYGSDFHGKVPISEYEKSKDNLFYMNSLPTFQGLKLSLLDQSSRIMTIDEYTKFSKEANYIISHIELDVNGTKKTITFGDSLNSFIGSRGSGKSYLLKSIVGDIQDYKSSNIFTDIKILNIYMKNGDNYKVLTPNMFDYLKQKGTKGSDDGKNFYNLLSTAPYNMKYFEQQIKQLDFMKIEKNNIDEYFSKLNDVIELYNRVYNAVETERDYEFISDYNDHFLQYDHTQKTYEVFSNLTKYINGIISKRNNELTNITKVIESLEKNIHQIKEINKYIDVESMETNYLDIDIENINNSILKLKNIRKIYSELIKHDLKVKEHTSRIITNLNEQIDNKTTALNSKLQLIEKYISDLVNLFSNISDKKLLIKDIDRPLTNVTSYEYRNANKNYIVNIVRTFYENEITADIQKEIFSKYNMSKYESNILVKIIGENGLSDYKETLRNTDKRYTYNSLEKPIINSKIEILDNDNKYEWDTMSPGQRSEFLLNIVLDEDSNKILLIDQPEDDLDNQTIFKTIVSKLRTLKKKRQIILVSHNANIVINGDSDSIIVNYNDDGNFDLINEYTESTNKINYSPLNNEFQIMELSAEILEGGREALRKRIKKIGNNNIFYKED